MSWSHPRLTPHSEFDAPIEPTYATPMNVVSISMSSYLLSCIDDCCQTDHYAPPPIQPHQPASPSSSRIRSRSMTRPFHAYPYPSPISPSNTYTNSNASPTSYAYDPSVIPSNTSIPRAHIPVGIPNNNPVPRIHPSYMPSQSSSSAFPTPTSATSTHLFSSPAPTPIILDSPFPPGTRRVQDRSQVQYPDSEQLGRYTERSEHSRDREHVTMGNEGSGVETETRERTGSSGKKHTCPHCSKRFNRPSSLKIHVNTHTGAKRMSWLSYPI